MVITLKKCINNDNYKSSLLQIIKSIFKKRSYFVINVNILRKILLKNKCM